MSESLGAAAVYRPTEEQPHEVLAKLPGMSLRMPSAPKVNGDYQAGTAIANGITRTANVAWRIGRLSTDAEFRQEAQRISREMSGAQVARPQTAARRSSSCVLQTRCPQLENNQLRAASPG